jgi:hypothetical protein
MQIDQNEVISKYRDIVRSGLNSREMAMLVDMMVSHTSVMSNSETRKNAAKVYLKNVYGSKSINPFEIPDLHPTYFW